MDSRKEREARRDILHQNMANQGDHARFEHDVNNTSSNKRIALTIRKFPMKQSLGNPLYSYNEVTHKSKYSSHPERPKRTAEAPSAWKHTP